MKTQFIREQRVVCDLTQEYLASELGVSRPTYMKIEQGERELTISEAEKLADVFGLTLTDFLAGKKSGRKVIIENADEEKSEEKHEELDIRVTKKDLDKFKQVLLYVLAKVGSKPNVGKTVLHKLLYFIDFDYYEKFEESLMGATYIKNRHGPTAVELDEILKEMEKQGDIEPVRSAHYKYQQKKYLPLKSPDLEGLTARDARHIDDVLTRLSDQNATEIAHYSHGDIPWRVAKEKEPLDYEVVFYREKPYSLKNYDDDPL